MIYFRHVMDNTYIFYFLPHILLDDIGHCFGHLPPCVFVPMLCCRVSVCSFRFVVYICSVPFCCRVSMYRFVAYVCMNVCMYVCMFHFVCMFRCEHTLRTIIASKHWRDCESTVVLRVSACSVHSLWPRVWAIMNALLRKKTLFALCSAQWTRQKMLLSWILTLLEHNCTTGAQFCDNSSYRFEWVR